MINEEKTRLRKKYNISQEDEKPYVMAEERDYEILARVKQLENKELSKEDREMIALIRSQLLRDWRKPILDKLNQLLEKYK